MRSDCTMRQFEVYIEESTPCGGTKYAKKEFFEVEAESPEAYVLTHAKWPIRAVERNGEGDLVVMDIEAFTRREKMLALREELLRVEADRIAGVRDITLDELSDYLDEVIGE